MNFIQRNPNDAKHFEYHDGEYEYWPLEDPIKTKSISIPAALVSGLELLAATAAAGLLALALSVLYITSTPRAITSDSATINANVYNNHSDHTIFYSLHPEANPDILCQEGTLEDDEDTLFLKHLNGGTAYLLKYYDPEQNEIGQFRFVTPGDPRTGDGPPEPSPEESPADPPDPFEPGIGGDTPSDPEPTSETVPSENTTEPTVPDTRPPVIVNPKPVPRPEPTPDPMPDPVVPDPPPDPDPEPEPDPEEPEINGITNQYISGVLQPDDLGYTQHFVFLNIPDNYDISVATDPDKEVYFEFTWTDGTLTVSVTDKLNFGESTTTTVTVHLPDGDISKVSTIAPPLLKDAALNVEKTGDNTYTYTVTATVAMTDGSALTEGITLKADLTPYTNADPTQNPVIPMTLQKVPGSSSQYIATYTCDFPLGTAWSKIASVAVTGLWDKISDEAFRQVITAMNSY